MVELGLLSGRGERPDNSIKLAQFVEALAAKEVDLESKGKLLDQGEV